MLALRAVGKFNTVGKISLEQKSRYNGISVIKYEN
jgi:hypothetical protein